jgi:predicted phage terminase large subunit-like protein
MDSWSYSGQYQQDPVPLEGGMAKRSWFEAAYYDETPICENCMAQADCIGCIYGKSHKVYMSWDMSFKGEPEAQGETSYVVGTLWAKYGPSFWMLDMFRAQIGFNDTLKNFLKWCKDYPRAQEKLIEDKANGTAIIDLLKKKIPGIIPVDTHNDPKEVRYGSVLWLIEAGNVRLPNPEVYADRMPWIEVALDELCRFPKGSRDDVVDSVTHGLIQFQETLIDPTMVPWGVGNDANRFGDPGQWSGDDIYFLNSLGVSRDWTKKGH